MFQRTFFLMFHLFQNYINLQVRTKKLVNSVDYHSCPLRLALGIHYYFFKLLRVLSLSRMIDEFSLTYICYHVWENFFNLWCHIRKYIQSMDIYSRPVPHSKLQVQLFENLCSPRAKNKMMEENMICFIKIQSEKMKITWNNSLFIFCMIYNFSKCDGSTVL